MVLAAAVLMAGAGLSFDIPEAWGGSHGGFSGGGGFRSGGGGFRGGGGMRGMGARPMIGGKNFQMGRSNNITRYKLPSSHVKSLKAVKPGSATPKSGQLKALGLQKQGLIAKQAKLQNFKKLSTQPQFKKASFSKPNVWSHKQWGGHGGDHHHHWVRWYGPVFWPYFMGDYFCYGFWPGDCADVYWGYGPDVIVWGAFWPYGEYYYNEPATDEHAGSSSGNGVWGYGEPAKPKSKKQPEAAAAAPADTCAGFAPGMSELPIQKLEGIVDATGEQRAAFDDLKGAVVQASEILKKACPTDPALTPVSRLDAMEQRLQAMEQANVVVKGPFVHLYDLLTGAQKRRLEAVSKPTQQTQQPARPKKMDVTELCTSQAGFTAVPAGQIAATLTLTEEQQQQLEKLKTASARASEELKNSCPSSMADTLDGRLDSAQQRLAALIGAVGTVRPAVRDFYASLTDEQKAALSIQAAPQNRG